MWWFRKNSLQLFIICHYLDYISLFIQLPTYLFFPELKILILLMHTSRLNSCIRRSSTPDRKLSWSTFLVIFRYRFRSSLLREFRTRPSIRCVVSDSVKWARPQSCAHSYATQLWSILAAWGYWQLKNKWVEMRILWINYKRRNTNIFIDRFLLV